MKTDIFQSCGHCWVFQICWHIEWSTFTASSFRIWANSTGIPSSPLALFVVMIPKAHLTSYSRMFSRQVYWSGLPCPPPGDLPNPGIKHISYVTCIGRWVLYHYRHLGMWDCGTHITFRAAQSHISSLVLVLRTHSKVRLLFSVLIMKGLTSLPMQAMKVSSHIDLEWLHALSAAVPDLLSSFSLACSVNQSCPTPFATSL